MLEQQIVELNQKLIKKFGKTQRIDKAIEELIELAHVLTKVKKIPSDFLYAKSDLLQDEMPALLDELADFAIMYACLIDALGIHQETLQEVTIRKVNKMKGYAE